MLDHLLFVEDLYPSSRSLSVFLLPEGSEFGAGVVGNHSFLTGLPAGGADFAVLVRELEGLHEAESLLDVAADGQVTDRNVAHHLVGVDDVGRAESHARIFALFDERTVVFGDLFVEVSEHGDVHFAESTLVSGLLGVFLMNEGGVDGASNDLGTDFLELSSSVGELADFGRANEGEIKGPEEEDNVLALELFQRDLLGLFVPPCVGSPLRSGVSNFSGHG